MRINVQGSTKSCNECEEEFCEMDETDFEDLSQLMPGAMQAPKSDFHLIQLHGEITDKSAAKIITQLMNIVNSKPSIQFEQIEATGGDFEKSEILIRPTKKYKPVKFIINTYGGCVLDTFAICDAMDMVKAKTDIVTIGMGKVFSAGILLIANGTMGKRMATPYTRFMIHSVSSCSVGAIHEMETGMKEAQKIQKMYSEFVIDHTSLNQKTFDSILTRKNDYYFSSEKALKLGLIDVIEGKKEEKKDKKG